MAALRSDLSALIAAGDHRAVRADLAAAAIDAPDVAACHRISGILDQIDAAKAGLTPVRVAVLTNYTAQPLVALLRTQAVPSGLAITTYLPGFDQWMPELLDDQSGLRSFGPQVVVLDLLLDTIAPSLTRSFLSLKEADIDAAIGEIAAVIENAIRALRAWSKARLLVHLPPRPDTPSLGILDASTTGQKAVFERLQQRIRQVCGGHDAYCVDTDRLVADVGAGAWRDRRMWALAKIPYSTAAFRRIADEHVRYLRPLTGRVRKVLVLDLDDTLWGGVIGERGEHGIDLGETYPGSGFVDFQHAIAELRRRGVVLALNSSNDADHVLDVMRRHPSMLLRPDDFSAHRINWNDKAANMIEIAAELGLGVDSFVFVDNSDAECARMRQAIPDVLTLQLPAEPASYGAWLRGLGVFDTLGFSDDDRTRAEMYRGEVERARHRDAIGSLDEYLRSLQMVLTVEKLNARNVSRAADLTQRTNQFNMTTRRRTAAEISRWIDSDSCDAYVFALADRFGAQGIIGFAAIQYGGDGRAVITDFMMSCRVLKRNVEQAMLATLLSRARSRGADRVSAEYVPTPRSAPFASFYESSGMSRGESDGGATRFEHRAGDAIRQPPHIEVQLAAAAMS